MPSTRVTGRGLLILAILVLAAGVSAAPALSQGKGLPPQTTTAEAVTVSVAPRDLSGLAKEWQFEVAFNTHTQPLGDDLMKAAALVDRGGARHAPLAWRGDGPGGHHRKGVLVFAPLVPRPAAIELQIQRGNEAAPRSFKWALR